MLQRWLAAMAVVPLAVATAAHAEVAALQRAVPAAAPTHTLNLKLPPDAQYVSQTALQRGMIAEEGVAPNALVGVGLARMSGRKARSLRVMEGPEPTRNPGVTFVLKF
jgi:hypothetical protein